MTSRPPSATGRMWSISTAAMVQRCPAIWQCPPARSNTAIRVAAQPGGRRRLLTCSPSVFVVGIISVVLLCRTFVRHDG